MQKIEQFIDLVKRTRKAQQEYFITRSGIAMTEAKKLEREVEKLAINHWDKAYMMSKSEEIKPYVIFDYSTGYHQGFEHGYQKATEAQKQSAMSLEECKNRIAEKYGFLSWQKMDAILEVEPNSQRDILFGQAAELYANQFREAKKWVSVEYEGFPDHYEPVMCGFFRGTYKHYQIGTKYKRNDGTFVFVDEEETSGINCTHWQPLPKAP